MDAHNRPVYPRAAVLLAVFLLHGSLVLVFLREKPVVTDRHVSPESSTTIFFIDPRLPLPPAETSRIPHHRPARNLQQRLRPDAAISSLGITAPAENQASAAPAAVDWLAEGQRSAAVIASRGESGRAAESPSSSTTPAPWDMRPLLESTDHGLTLRIPVEIPGKIIDHCFGNMDLGHDMTGHWERYQLGCAFGKQPARGDLFDFLRKPPELQK